MANNAIGSVGFVKSHGYRAKRYIGGIREGNDKINLLFGFAFGFGFGFGFCAFDGCKDVFTPIENTCGVVSI